jgi:hypothetical protein
VGKATMVRTTVVKAHSRQRIYEKRYFHAKSQPRTVQSKTARPQQVFGLHTNRKNNRVRQNNQGIIYPWR